MGSRKPHSPVSGHAMNLISISLLTPEGKKLNAEEMYLIFDSVNFLRGLMGGKSFQSNVEHLVSRYYLQY